MLIVDYDTFVRMPAGTIFAPWEPCVYGDEPEIKVDAGHEYVNHKGEKDWCYNGTMTFVPEIVGAALEAGKYESEPFYYDGDQNDARDYKLFAVWEPHEVERLISCLRWAQHGCPGDYERYIGAVWERIDVSGTLCRAFRCPICGWVVEPGHYTHVCDDEFCPHCGVKLEDYPAVKND